MHPAPEQRKVGYGWLQPVVPAFNDDIRKEYEQQNFIFPGSAEFARRRSSISFDLHPPSIELRPPPFVGQIPWVTPERLQRTLRCWKFRLTPPLGETEFADPDDEYFFTGLSISDQAPVRLSRASSCPRLERRGHDPSLCAGYVPPPPPSPPPDVKRGRGRPASVLTPKVKIQTKFMTAKQVALSGQLAIDPGVTNKEQARSALGLRDRNKFFIYPNKPAPLHEAFAGADLAGPIPPEFKPAFDDKELKKAKPKSQNQKQGLADVKWCSGSPAPTRE